MILIAVRAVAECWPSQMDYRIEFEAKGQKLIHSSRLSRMSSRIPGVELIDAFLGRRRSLIRGVKECISTQSYRSHI
jgi:hypothetical protein